MPRGCRRTAGFDAQGHLDYIERVQAHDGLPFGDQGAEMFQPPLYYWLSAATLGLSGRSVGDPGDIVVVRATNLLIALIGLVLIWKSLRLIFPTHPQRAALGFVVAAMLPMQLTPASLPDQRGPGGHSRKRRSSIRRCASWRTRPPGRGAMHCSVA